MEKRKIFNKSINLDILKTHSFEEIEKERWKNGVFCPWFKSNKYWLNGSSSKKTKRYKFIVCKKSFHCLTNTFLSYSKLTLEQWDKYLNSYFDSESCKIISKKVGITVQDAWRNHERWNKINVWWYLILINIYLLK